MSIIIFIISLAILILVHEFGHFIVAKKSGIRVDEFGLGFPPKLLSKKWGETTYTLNAIPFGGFVRIFGEDPVVEQSSLQGSARNDQTNFQNKPKWIQAFVLVAGVAMNLLFAWLLIFILLWRLENVLIAFPESLQVTWFILKETVLGLCAFLWHIVSFHADFSQVAGPVGIASVFKEAAVIGFSQVVYLVSLISINLAVINLLPFPALDGGRLLFVAIEAITRRPIPPKFVSWTNAVGFIILIILMIIITTHDIFKLI